MNKEIKWYTGNLDYEGFPLYLRFPEKTNFDELAIKYPTFLWIEQILEKVKDNGLPESDYNNSLFDFDGDIIDMFQNDESGKCVLVETFGGKRTYYIYTQENFIESKKAYLQEKYPQHKLEWGFKEDKNWNFIKEYSKDYRFYE